MTVCVLHEYGPVAVAQLSQLRPAMFLQLAHIHTVFNCAVPTPVSQLLHSERSQWRNSRRVLARPRQSSAYTFR
jgi:hypothetical protein